ncbi:MAG TPA: hypothetical protein VFW40_02955, partial [Capsulimonadaceae bacterium]|nr:hypothetical protein [Capsulimonadaceae bacterium]
MYGTRFELLENTPLAISSRVPGLNAGGVMSLTYQTYPSSGGNEEPCQMFARGLVETRDGKSCILRMDLCGDQLIPGDPLLHPQSRPVSEALNLPIWGYEDQTVLRPDTNFVERGQFGLLVVEACLDAAAPTGWTCSLLYHGLVTQLTKTVLTPAEAVARGLSMYNHVEMVKEAQVFRDADGKLKIHIEVRADHRSRVVVGDIEKGEI